MSKFKTGDKVRIVKCCGEGAWYKNNIGELYTIDTNTPTLHDRKYWYIVEKPKHTIFVDDIELELAVQEPITTEDAILRLQCLVDLTGDGVEIIIRENDLFVKAFDKQFYCENADVLEEAAKAAAFLSRQEIV
jgi:hypothetical protein